VDCGGDSDEIAADAVLHQLRSQYIFRLDGIIVTHYDEDHAGGVPLLLSMMPVDTLYLPGEIGEDAPLRQVLAEFPNVQWVPANIHMILDDVPIRILTAEAGVSENENSLCVLFQPQICDILITGDRGFAGEKALISRFDLPKVEILLAGHHGTGNSTGVELLRNIKPSIVAISVGENSYGHPNSGLLNRLTEFGCRIVRTDQNGTITFRG
jgi:competence protein ComEC